MSQEGQSLLQKIWDLVTGCHNETKDFQIRSMKFGRTIAWTSLNGTVNKLQGTSGYDIVVYPDGSTSSRKKRSEVLTPNFPSQLPSFLSLKLKVYLFSLQIQALCYFLLNIFHEVFLKVCCLCKVPKCTHTMTLQF